jgi:hypothetical protein
MLPTPASPASRARRSQERRSSASRTGRLAKRRPEQPRKMFGLQLPLMQCTTTSIKQRLHPSTYTLDYRLSPSTSLSVSHNSPHCPLFITAPITEMQATKRKCDEPASTSVMTPIHTEHFQAPNHDQLRTTASTSTVENHLWKHPKLRKKQHAKVDPFGDGVGSAEIPLSPPVFFLCCPLNFPLRPFVPSAVSLDYPWRSSLRFSAVPMFFCKSRYLPYKPLSKVIIVKTCRLSPPRGSP